MTSLQTKLARMNRVFDEDGYQRLRESAVVNQIRGKGRTQSEELARLRKAVSCLFEAVLKLHPDIAENEEFRKFMEYHTEVESITAEVKKYLPPSETEALNNEI